MFRDLTLEEAVKFYIDNGFYLLPVIGKNPAKFKIEKMSDGSSRRTSEGWQHLRTTEDNYKPIFDKKELGLTKDISLNVAVMGSKGQQTIVDIDLDCTESRVLAPHYLPKCNCIFGRKTAVDSHYVYLSDSSAEKMVYTKFSIPLNDNEKGKKETDLLEIRPLDCTRYTVFPPSRHKNTGELIEFSVFEMPSQQDFSTIKQSCKNLAVASLMARYWDEGIRQDLTIALTGMLLKLGWKLEEVENFVKPILEEFDDPGDYRTRSNGMKQTAKKFNNGGNVIGFSRINELLPAEAIVKMKLWLDMSQRECPIVEVNNALYIKTVTQKGVSNKKLSTFSINLLKSINVKGKGEYLDAKIVTENKKEYLVKFTPKDFNLKEFRAVLESQCKGRSAVFYGTDKDLQYIKTHLDMQSVEESLGFPIAGFQYVDDKMHFITKEGSLVDKDGEIVQDDSVVYAGNYNASCDLINVSDFDLGTIESVKYPLLNFNERHIVQGVLGWTISTFFKQFFISNNSIRSFPFLYLSGSAGSGKSRTAQDIIYRIWGVDEHLKSFNGQTDFTLMSHLSHTDNIPIVFDEVKLSRMTSRQANLFSNMIRIAYNNSEANRGHADQSMSTYCYYRPFAICSESGLSETAHKERCIFLTLGSEMSKKYTEYFKALQKENLSLIGKTLVDYILQTPPDVIQNKLAESLEDIPAPFRDRPAVSLLSVTFGIRMLEEVFGVTLGTKEITAELADYFYSSDEGSKLSEIDKTLSSWCLMSKYSGEIEESKSYIYNPHLESGVHYQSKDGILKLHVPGIFPLFRKWDRDHQHLGDLLDKGTFNSQIKNEPYFIDNKPTLIGSRVQRCVILDIKKMVEKGVEIFHPWIEDELSQRREMSKAVNAF